MKYSKDLNASYDARDKEGNLSDTERLSDRDENRAHKMTNHENHLIELIHDDVKHETTVQNVGPNEKIPQDDDKIDGMADPLNFYPNDQFEDKDKIDDSGLGNKY